MYLNKRDQALMEQMLQMVLLSQEEAKQMVRTLRILADTLEGRITGAEKAKHELESTEPGW